LTAAPPGFAALFRRSLGSGKDSLGYENRVLRSTDGLSWEEHPVPLGLAQFYRAIGSGSGEIVLAGSGVATSTNGADWTERAVARDAADGLEAVAFLQGRFFALSLQGRIWSSHDATSWTSTKTDTVQLSDIAFGNGRYVAVGSGPFQVSNDGQAFHSASLDCAMPGACIVDPSQVSRQGPKTRVLFAGDTFYAHADPLWSTDGFSSRDGEEWTHVDDASSVPQGYWGGWLMRRDGDAIVAWQPGTSIRKRASLTEDNPDRLSCVDHRCFVLQGHDAPTVPFVLLVLVP
jgi:hypothetical protein